MGHLPIRGTKGFIAILALMAFAGIRLPFSGILSRQRTKALPGTFPDVQPQVFDIAA